MMKYCTSYYQPENIRAKVDEIRFPIQNLTVALTYANNHSDKRIIIEIASLTAPKIPSLDKLSRLQEETPNLTYDFFELQDLAKYNKSTNCGRNYMYHYPAVTWAMIQILMYHKVSDIYIGEPLVFDLNAISKYVKENGIKIRVCPHKVKNEFTKEIESDLGIRHFFVLPQDADAYGDYIDVFELLDRNIVREEALVRTYTAKEPYTHALDYLIENIGVELNCALVDDRWITRRLNCQQRCLKSPKECDFCYRHMRMLEAVKNMRES